MKILNQELIATTKVQIAQPLSLPRGRIQFSLKHKTSRGHPNLQN